MPPLPFRFKIASGMNAIASRYRKLFSQFSRQPFSSFLDTFFAFFATWTLWWNVAYFSDLSLSTASYLLVPAILIAPHIMLLKGDEERELGVQSVVTVLRERALMAIFVFIAVILTLSLHRPDADDQHLLSWAFSLASHPMEPVTAIPGYQSDDRGVVSFEPLRAALAHITDTPLLYWYYLMLPALIAAMTVIATGAGLRELVGRLWPISMLFYFVVMLAWGDAHRTHANFGFVRFFQGKSALVNLIVPAIFFYFFRYQQSDQKRYYLFMLCLVLTAGVGFSRGGIVIGPIVVGLLSVLSLRAGQAKKMYWLLVALALMALPLAWLLHEHIAAGGPVFTERGYVDSTTNKEMYRFVAGDGFRAYFMLVATALSVYAVTNPALKDVYRRYVLVFFVLLAIPLTSELFAKYIHVYLSWRWFWIIPFPMMAAVAAAGFYQWILNQASRAVAVAATLAIAALFTVASPRLVVSKENYTSVGWPNFKLDRSSIYFLHFEQTAEIRGARLYLPGSAVGY